MTVVPKGWKETDRGEASPPLRPALPLLAGHKPSSHVELLDADDASREVVAADERGTAVRVVSGRLDPRLAVPGEPDGEPPLRGVRRRMWMAAGKFPGQIVSGLLEDATRPRLILSTTLRT